MLKIRLKRLGRKKKACYRIIIIDSRKKRDGKPIEEVGYYNPISKQKKINIIKINKSIKEGAQMTKVVRNLIKNNYIKEGE
uniref:Small ribosomal subunit protein bS16c n=1 Tax=Dasyclonium flaccidum TaxID=2007274 RepID=A0A1Z1MLC0_9FLOR|nr:ribosomal protein S16 [Dasyclonium flaccidum]ARW66726.1 ribosomal protein S16 [Dasyclonium flaccidum]